MQNDARIYMLYDSHKIGTKKQCEVVANLLADKLNLTVCPIPVCLPWWKRLLRPNMTRLLPRKYIFILAKTTISSHFRDLSKLNKFSQFCKTFFAV